VAILIIILLVLALVFFILAALKVASRVEFLALGLACWVLTALIQALA
jgi:hypothetical protein